METNKETLNCNYCRYATKDADGNVLCKLFIEGIYFQKSKYKIQQVVLKENIQDIDKLKNSFLVEINDPDDYCLFFVPNKTSEFYKTFRKIERRVDGFSIFNLIDNFYRYLKKFFFQDFKDTIGYQIYKLSNKRSIPFKNFESVIDLNKFQNNHKFLLNVLVYLLLKYVNNSDGVLNVLLFKDYLKKILNIKYDFTINAELFNICDIKIYFDNIFDILEYNLIFISKSIFIDDYPNVSFIDSENGAFVFKFLENNLFFNFEVRKLNFKIFRKLELLKEKNRNRGF